MSGEIQSKESLVQSFSSSFERNAGLFGVRISGVSGGTAGAISRADSMGGVIGNLAQRYASVLPRSAQDVRMIAEMLGDVDAGMSDQFVPD